MRLIQIQHAEEGRRIGVVSDSSCHLIDGFDSVYALAQSALEKGASVETEVTQHTSDETLDYEKIYTGNSEWQLLPAFDHPDEPARCLVCGTGLTHIGSAKDRDAMHVKESTDAPLTDSMKVFQWGVDGGKPGAGNVGVQPEWFYKGFGSILRAHGQPLTVPEFGDDGGEEPEIAGAYVIDQDGTPRRIGLMVGNEFADHVMEKKNYLYLAPSKLRDASIGPELVVGADFNDIAGAVTIERQGKVVWSREIKTGEANMSHSLANLEHHHFKYDQHRRPGDAHVHFYGADGLSFGAGISLVDGDMMVIEWEGFGRALRNPIRIMKKKDRFIEVKPL